MLLESSSDVCLFACFLNGALQIGLSEGLKNQESIFGSLLPPSLPVQIEEARTGYWAHGAGDGGPYTRLSPFVPI